MQRDAKQVSEQARAHRWTRAQYDQMIEAGMLDSDDKVELIFGAIVPRSPQGSEQFALVSLLYEALRNAYRDAPSHVRMQGPLLLGDDSEPEPDLAVVDGTIRDYVDRHPDDARLVIEVAQSSLDKDRGLKQTVYARHGIAEYWIVDVERRRLEVYGDPSDDAYQTKRTLTDADAITPPGTSTPVRLADIFPEQ